MPVVFRHRRFSACAAWLALAAVVLRGLLPFGYMPARASAGEPGITLVWCSGGSLVTHPKTPGLPSSLHAAQCAFAFSAMAALPPTAAALVSLPTFPERPGFLYRPLLAVACPHTRPPARAPPSLS
jgi:hypothetical protein